MSTTNTTQGLLTLYTHKINKESVVQIIQNQFAEVIKTFNLVDKHQLALTFMDETSIHFNLLTGQKETGAQIYYMTNYFSQAPLKNTAVKDAALKQISQFNTIVGINFKINTDQKRTNYIVNTIYDIAKDLNGFVLHNNMALYTHDSKLLIALDGRSDYDSWEDVPSFA